MTVKQVIDWVKPYISVDSYYDVLEQINNEMIDIAIKLEHCNDDSQKKKLNKSYKDLLEKREIILLFQEQRLILFKKAGF